MWNHTKNSMKRLNKFHIFTMKSGIKEEIKDKGSSPAFIQSLNLLNHSANFSSSDDGLSGKKIKPEDDFKGEYFEDISNDNTSFSPGRPALMAPSPGAMKVMGGLGITENLDRPNMPATPTDFASSRIKS